ncbi:MAG TPA: xanthine dehydrogenase accessory protein XdhC [Caldimonas sp.]|jgi:xanthine dehydrogenase accessory factor|nr:xanthine dehydrogenase accessory protein XdhC [Caldimonas sp.]HEV7574548.1 xanthine dehydrogenase accessory protein XdhC [Caldimonas sp.]
MTGSFASLRTTADEWRAAARSAIVVEVVSTRGSAPREAGTRMLVGRDECAGTIGGGHLELKAIAAARAMLAGAIAQRSEQSFALGPSLGQCCGGAVTLAFAPLDADALARWPARVPHFRLQLHGAGHVGRAIATLLATLDVEVDWFDERDDGFADATTLGSPWPAHIRRIAADTVEREVANAPAGACFLVLTHEHALDLRITEAILRRGDFAFCGLIGSKTKRATFARRLAERGVAAAAIARMTCPIGAIGIAGRAPEVIAVAAVAELLRVASAAPALLPDLASRSFAR